MLRQDIIIHEVGLRDGLQVEKATVPTEEKRKWVDALMDSGVDIIQVGSFVHPEKVPQMADTDELFRVLSKESKHRPVVLSGLVLNEKGLERGMDVGVEMFCMGVSASETHSQKNTGMGSLEAQQRIIGMTAAPRLPSALAGQDYKFSITQEILDGDNTPIEVWYIEGAWIENADFTDLDYAASETIKIQLAISYDHARQEILGLPGRATGGMAPTL